MRKTGLAILALSVPIAVAMLLTGNLGSFAVEEAEWMEGGLLFMGSLDPNWILFVPILCVLVAGFFCVLLGRKHVPKFPAGRSAS